MHRPSLDGSELPHPGLEAVATWLRRLANNTQGQIPVDSAEELVAIADILRASREVTFEANGQVLTTAQKPVGTV